MAFWPSPPVVLTTPGPTWATNVNSILNLLPTHNHSQTGETQVPTAGLNINANLPIFSSSTAYGTTLASFYGYTAQAPTGVPNAATYVSAAGDIWYKNSSGVGVQLTSGGTPVPNGTGTYNGFYGDYATGSPGAIAYYRSANGYELFATAATATPTSYTALSAVKAQSFAAYNSLGFVAFDPALTTIAGGNYTAKGGLGLGSIVGSASNGSFAVRFDGTNGSYPGNADGTYKSTSLSIINTSYRGNVATLTPFQYAMGLNVPAADGTTSAAYATNPFDLFYYSNKTNTPHTMVTYQVLTSGTPTVGFGNRHYYTAATAAWSGYGSAVSNAVLANQAVIDSNWFSMTGPAGGLHLHGIYNNVISTSGLTVAALDNAGADYFGMGVAPSTAYRLDVGPTGSSGGLRVAGVSTLNGAVVTNSSLTVAGAVSGVTSLTMSGALSGGTSISASGTATVGALVVTGTSALQGTTTSQSIFPQTTGNYAIGSVSTIYTNVATRAVTSDTGNPLVLSETGGTSLTVGSNSCTSTGWFVPGANASNTTASFGVNNAVRAWGRITSAGVVTGGMNVASATAFSVVGGALQMTITLTAAVPTTAAIIATIDGSNTTANQQPSCTATWQDSTHILIQYTAAGAQTGVHFMVVGF